MCDKFIEGLRPTKGSPSYCEGWNMTEHLPTPAHLAWKASTQEPCCLAQCGLGPCVAQFCHGKDETFLGTCFLVIKVVPNECYAGRRVRLRHENTNPQEGSKLINACTCKCKSWPTQWKIRSSLTSEACFFLAAPPPLRISPNA